jgi:hypothetical protein
LVGHALSAGMTITSGITHVKSAAIGRMRLNKFHAILSCILLPLALSFGIDFAKSFHKSVDVAKVLRTLPKEDRESLDWWFRHFWESSYVIFGNKPMSFRCVNTVEPYNPQILQVYGFMDSICRLYLENFAQIKGVEAWEKHKHLFPSSRFIILENYSPDCITIFVINKQAFLSQVEENISYFREVLGNSTTPQQVLNDCLKSNDLYKDVLKNHHGLIGILLGFGRHNATLFSRRCQITDANEPQEFSLTKKPLIPSHGFSSLDEELSDIHSRFKSFDDIEANDFNPLLLSLPGFVADHTSPETKKLQTEYMQQYKKIVKIHKNRNFLEATLNQFCNN